ncbi:MAG: electron transfer flavoprotein subunit alpha [Candidatus Muirbacterium halophilum]|nr:electron transfer flavoprotein subunit alpha [Candidatus Muirbacterium halophilum]MCK9477034.1 electron transfer flavoprotein subunit alpha [Candidatus Muirbacterium halophilum]
MKVFITKDECIGCKKCISHCPFNAIDFSEKKAFINEEKCTTCGACLEVCPVNAIHTTGKDKDVEKDFSCYKNIWVIAEFLDGKIKNVSLELISTAKRLSQKTNSKVWVVSFGDKITEMSENLAKYGADGVYVVEDQRLATYETLVGTHIVTELVKKYKPEIVLFGATHMGRDLAPRVANKLLTGLTADCTALEICDETKLILQTRPAFGGNIMATIMCPDHRPQMSTVRPGVMKLEEVENPNKIEMVKVNDIDFAHYINAVKIIESVKEIKHNVNLEDARIIISGGRGMGSKDNFEKLYSLAEKIGGEVGASRAAIEDGWAASERQVGQTGKTVRPELYIALGISGAIQHTAGMENSSYIIAINKDFSAPILKIADLGIVGDVNKILPVLEEELPKLMEKGSEI